MVLTLTKEGVWMDIKQGSKEWFLGIAEALGELLLGIEVYNNTGQDVSPPVQVGFTIPVYYNTAPHGVAEAGRFPGFRGAYWCVRGNERHVVSLLFDFYPPLICPDSVVVLEVAKELDLAREEDEVWRESGFMGRYHDRLFDTPG